MLYVDGQNLNLELDESFFFFVRRKNNAKRLLLQVTTVDVRW